MTPSKRLGSTRHILGLVLLAGFLSVGVPSLAGTLEGTIISANGEPRPYARVNAIGPQQRVTVSDQEGKFRIDAAGGIYLIRVIDGKRQADIRVTIPNSGSLSREFRVDW